MRSTLHRRYAVTPRSQPDLFDGRATRLQLTPELRAKLTTLLQSLLTEAVGLGQPDTAPDARAKEDGDDQDHA
jgi:hypothetical protein